MRPLTQHLPWSLSRLHSAPTPCMWTTANSNTLVWGFLPESEQCGPWLGFQHRPSALEAARCPGFPPLSLSPITPHPISHSPWRPIPSGFQTHAPSMMSQRHFGVNGNTLSHCPSSPTMSGTAIPDHTPQMALSSPPSCPCPAGLHHNLIDGESPCHPLHPP